MKSIIPLSFCAAVWPLSKSSKHWLLLASSILLGIGFCLSIGCGGGQDAKEMSDTAIKSLPPPAVLNLLVVGTPEIGERVSREWAARRDGELNLSTIGLAELIESQHRFPDSVDVVVFPPSILPQLVEAKMLLAVPKEVLSLDEVNRNELLMHFRSQIIRYDDETWGFPLGSPNFALMGNRAFFDSSEVPFPNRWGEVDDVLAATDAIEKANLQANVDMPLAEGWAAQTFLARVAPSITYSGTLTSVFDRQTMKPLLETEPFLKALEQLSQIASPDSLEATPARVFNKANSGESLLAISWPSRAFAAADVKQSDGSVLMIRSLPGARRWFDQRGERWMQRGREEESRADLIGFEGFMIGVTKDSPNERTAWRFATWLTSKPIGLETMVELEAAGPFRASYLGDISRWTGESISYDVANEYADVITANHERALTLRFPRLPGQERYLEALDQAVRSAVAGKTTPEAALATVSQQWEAITESFGRDQQRSALRKETGF